MIMFYIIDIKKIRYVLSIIIVQIRLLYRKFILSIDDLQGSVTRIKKKCKNYIGASRYVKIKLYVHLNKKNMSNLIYNVMLIKLCSKHLKKQE